MEREEIKQKLDSLLIGVDDMASMAKSKILDSVNLIESLASENFTLATLNQKLRDELNLLKGEHGKPNIKANSKGGNGKGGDFSSENERNKKKKKKKRKPKNKKRESVKINRIETLDVPPEQLPVDAVFKGYKSSIVQDLKIETDNVEFRCAVYYSPSLKKSYIAPLPSSYTGEFGPCIRSLILVLNRDGGLTEEALHKFVTTFGIQIAKSTISDMLTKGLETFHEESNAILKVALKSGCYQQIDDTGARVKGRNHYTHVLCNDYYTYYSTQAKKDRLTVLKVMSPDGLKFLFNQGSVDLMKEWGLADKWMLKVKDLITEEVLTESELMLRLQGIFPDANKQKTNRALMIEAAALNWYKQSGYAIDCLISDDAPQFKGIASTHGLCWIHEGRHYKKLTPLSEYTKQLVTSFLDKFWDFYHKQPDYKLQPCPKLALKLEQEFDTIFATRTEYTDLDNCIARTQAKKRGLLVFLLRPDAPSHNNTSELGTRKQARIRDIHFHTMSELGTKAKDTFATITQTARKLGINVYNYIHDRISKKFAMPALADVLAVKLAEVKFNTS